MSCGWIQSWGGKKKEIRAGDVISCPCGEKHWHGATTTTGMSHIAVQEWLNGKPVDWLEKVGDDQYLSELLATKSERRARVRANSFAEVSASE